jgi:hypothetical protein
MTNGTALPPQPDEILVRGDSTGVDYAPHAAGPHAAVCCDVVDLGVWQDQFPGRPPRDVRKIRLVFQTSEIRADGQRFTVSRMFSASLNEKATLRKFLESWRGRPFTPEELSGFNLVKLIGAPALVQVKHRQKQDKTYADVDSIMQLPRGMTKLAVENYIRVKDRARHGNADGECGRLPAAD